MIFIIYDFNLYFMILIHIYFKKKYIYVYCRQWTKLEKFQRFDQLNLRALKVVYYFYKWKIDKKR